MSVGWRPWVLDSFVPAAAALTIVADPDGLLLEEGVLEELRARGFDLLTFDDSVAFRYVFETRFREKPIGGAVEAEEAPELAVVVRGPESELDRLPYDLLRSGRRLAFSLGDLFPQLSYPVVAALDRSDLDRLFAAQARETPGPLGNTATANFILRHVFDFVPEQSRGETDLLRFLLRLHYRGRLLPAVFRVRLMHVVRRDRTVRSWPLEEILSDRDAFYEFLQERWPAYLDSIPQTSDERVEDRPVLPLSYAGPPLLAFDHPDVRVYIDNLFLEGALRVTSHPRGEELADHWAGVGILRDIEADRRDRLKRLAEAVREQVPESDARHADWLLFARRWAEVIVRTHAMRAFPDTDLGEALEQLRERVDVAFAEWLPRRYAGLHNQPADPPAMAHQIPRVLARHAAGDPDSKLALLVFDGMALDQWLILRDTLIRDRPDWLLHESAVFTWVPTVSSVARQAIFAGRPPLYFPESIESTDRDGQAWVKFWKAHGLAGDECGHMRGVRDIADLPRVEEMVAHPGRRMVGITVDKIDRIMHGMQLGTGGMHNQTRQWAEEGFPGNLLDLLHQHRYRVFITSDHGNVEAEGIGRPAEGATADLRGERVRVFRTAATRALVKARFDSAIEWPPVGLPRDYLPLLAPGRSAFVSRGERIIAHGGISVEELIVPFVQIERRVA